MVICNINDFYSYNQRYEAFNGLLCINSGVRMTFQRDFKNSINVR